MTSQTRTTASMRRCIGSAKFGIEAHDAPTADFPAQPSQKDGLGRMCKTHWTLYTRALRAGSIERKAATPAGFAGEPSKAGAATPAPKPKPTKKATTAKRSKRPQVDAHIGTTPAPTPEPVMQAAREAGLIDSEEAEMLADRRDRVKAWRRDEFAKNATTMRAPGAGEEG